MQLLQAVCPGESENFPVAHEPHAVALAAATAAEAVPAGQSVQLVEPVALV